MLKFSKIYNVVYNGEKIFFGEKEKSKRTCRFCKRSYPEVKFSQKAHAISEALGNNYAFCNDECDECNAYFGKEIEPSLISFFEFSRLFFNSSSKKTKNILKNRSIKCVRDDSGIEITPNEKYKGSYPFLTITPNGASISIEHQQKFVPQKAYKALCKFAISCLDNEDLQLTEHTVAWIRTDELLQQQFPRGIVWSFYYICNIHPQLHISILTNDEFPDKKAMICDFFFLDIMWSFRLPFLENDLSVDIKYNCSMYDYQKKSITKFINKFEYVDFSSTEKIPLVSTLESC